MSKQTYAHIGVILLAAGNSARLGKPKQLLEYQGKTLLRHAVDTILAVSVGATVVITGALTDEITTLLTDVPVNVTRNPDWQQGMASSIQTGLNALQHILGDGLKGALIMLCDQPMITPAHLQQLAALFMQNPEAVVATAYSGINGVPAIFSKTMFPLLETLTGDQGARQLFARQSEGLLTVPFEGAAIDVDTLADYRKLIGEG